jgi:hypothetical protein
MMKKTLLALVATLSALSLAHAANIASDDQTQTAYDDGWTTGDNGGTGFGAWTLTTTSGDGGQNGHFIASSTGNADGLDNGTVGGVASDGDIDTGGEAWGMYANSGQTAGAVRPLSGGSLSVGQTITLDFDNGYIDNGSVVGIGLQNSSGENVWEAFFVGGNSSYQFNQSGGVTNTAVGYTDEGLSIAFTLTGASTYSATITTLGGASDTISGSLLSPAGGSSVDQIRIFNFNAGSGGSANVYANSLQVIPEPTTMAMMGIGLAGAFLARRRRQKNG